MIVMPVNTLMLGKGRVLTARLVLILLSLVRRRVSLVLKDTIAVQGPLLLSKTFAVQVIVLDQKQTISVQRVLLLRPKLELVTTPLRLSVTMTNEQAKLYAKMEAIVIWVFNIHTRLGQLHWHAHQVLM